MTRARGWLPLLLVAWGAFAPASTASDEEPTEAVKAALVAAATKHDGSGMAKALEAANALVGAQGTFPDPGALADWLATLPDPVPADRAVRARRAWMYVVTRRGAEAIGLLDALLLEDPTNALFLAYLGEARRQDGDVVGALDALAAAMKAGADDAAVVPSIAKLLFDLRSSPPKDEPRDVAPSYATAADRLFASRPMVDVRLSLVGWLRDDLLRARGDASRSEVLARELARHLVLAAALPLPDGEAPRLVRTALELAARMAAHPNDVAGTTRFDVLAVAVRLGARADGEGHDAPEALAELAEAALAKGRFVLASHLARRRLAISESPTARRVLRSLPPDMDDGG